MIKKYIEKIVREMLEDKKDRFWKEFVYCNECGTVVKIDKAHKVMEREVYKNCPVILQLDNYKYYCGRHKKDYDRIEITENGKVFYKDNVEVDENGKIITKRKP